MAKPKTCANASGVLVPQYLAQRLRTLCDARGVSSAAADVGISRAAAVRVLAGKGVRKGTVALVAAHFRVRVQIAGNEMVPAMKRAAC